jgi:rhodanese-related sulfurtransferase
MHMPSNLILWILLVGVVVFFLYIRFGSIRGMQNMNAQQFQDAIQQTTKSLVIDVRETGEFKSGHIAGAINYPLSQLNDTVMNIPADKQLFIYCQSGMRSRQAGRILSKKGYTNLVNLQGGFMSWKGKTAK